MSQSDEETFRRRDPRYVEESENLSDWITVKLAEQFGEQRSANGLLCDLTPRAVRVAFSEEDEIPNFYVGTQVMLVFRFRNLATVTASASVIRVDQLENRKGMVFYFDFLRESDREAITRICVAYNKNRELPEESSGDSQ